MVPKRKNVVSHFSEYQPVYATVVPVHLAVRVAREVVQTRVCQLAAVSVGHVELGVFLTHVHQVWNRKKKTTGLKN